MQVVSARAAGTTIRHTLKAWSDTLLREQELVADLDAAAIALSQLKRPMTFYLMATVLSGAQLAQVRFDEAARRCVEALGSTQLHLAGVHRVCIAGLHCFPWHCRKLLLQSGS